MKKQLNAREMKIVSKVLTSWIKVRQVQKGLATSMGNDDVVGSVDKDMPLLIETANRLAEALEELEKAKKLEAGLPMVIPKMIRI